LTPKELAKWLAYFQIEPPQAERMDWLFTKLIGRIELLLACKGVELPVIEGKTIQWSPKPDE
jgi:hypothetical protein